MQEKNAECKIKVHFFLIFLLLYARRIGGLPLRWLSLRSCRVRPRVRPLRADNSYLAMLERFLRPRVRHFVYCARMSFGYIRCAAHPLRAQCGRSPFFVFRPILSGIKNNSDIPAAAILYVYYPAFDAGFLPSFSGQFNSPLWFCI